MGGGNQVLGRGVEVRLAKKSAGIPLAANFEDGFKNRGELPPEHATIKHSTNYEGSYVQKSTILRSISNQNRVELSFNERI